MNGGLRPFDIEPPHLGGMLPLSVGAGLTSMLGSLPHANGASQPHPLGLQQCQPTLPQCHPQLMEHGRLQAELGTIAPVPTPCRNMVTQGFGNAWQTPPSRKPTVDPNASSDEARVTKGDQPVVPVEYATSKLWGVTSEYENLLNIQRDQHLLAIRHSEAELTHLRKTIEMLELGKFRDDNVVARIKSKEQEASLAVQAKQKELELFTHLLQMRDRQIGDLQEMCQAKQSHIDQIQGQANTSRLDAGDKDVFAKALQDAELLRREKCELEQLLLAKEKQINAVQAVDPDLSDSSALQLGAQAIQMFHDSVRMKADAAANGQENQELREEIVRLQGVIVDLEATVDEKRSEIKEISNTLTQKMQKVFELETTVETLRKESRHAATAAAAQLEKAHEETDKRRHDHHASQQLLDELKAELNDRDQRISKQQEENTQQQATCQLLQQKVAEMNVQLVQATEVMGQMLQTGNYKDQIVREMTEKASHSESQLLRYLMSDKMSARQDTTRLSKDVLEPSCSSERRASADEPRDVRRASAASSARTPSVRAVSSTAIPGGSGLVAAAAPRPGGFGALDGACEMEIERFLSPNDTPRSSQPPSKEPWSYSSQRRRSDVKQQPPQAGSKAAAALDVLSVPNYRPHPDDIIDAQLAEFVNQRQFSSCRALFCRLSIGSYLYGTQRVSLRVGSKLGGVEALVDGDWIAVGEFVQRMQHSQGIHLQRAKEAM